MKKLLLIMLIGVLSSGCQIIERDPFGQTESSIDDELLPYYEAFLDEREKLGFTTPLPDINIIFGDNLESKTWRGQCAVNYTEKDDKRYITERTITIRQDHYERVMKQDGEGYHKGIEMLVFHEIAHCFWEAEHSDKLYPRTIQVDDDEQEVMCRDIMYYKGSSYRGTRDYYCYTQHFDLYQQQLYDIMITSNPSWR